MTAPRVSVVIPTLNGADTLPPLLDSIRGQRSAGAIEIVAIDSGSTDGTVEMLERSAATVLRIPRGEFNHGTTRNAAIGFTKGELVVLFVQDARLAHDRCIEALVGPLMSDERIAGTFARQRPRRDASALTKHYLERWMAASASPWRSELSRRQMDFDAMNPMERLRACTFDNVAACIRRSVWERHPFKPTPIAEDIEWAREVLFAGYSLAFVPDAVVEHSHERSAVYEYERTRLLHARLYELVGLETIPDSPSLARAVVSSLFRHIAVERRTPARWPRAAALAFAWPCGQYMGARLARSGRSRPRTTAGRV